MHQKPSDELVGAEGHLFTTAAVTVIAPLEGDRITLHFKDAVVGDGDSVGIASQILHDTGSISKRWLAVNHPFLLVAYLQEILVYLGKV